ncbi:hypothetical protein FIBSPDRAFT_866912 [Athelia psychrophila]|uniref:Uncharacterized protein n=1 Tax=Athelia psychrophila TaxID=1759441 RepID=A0A166EFX2_9AGAM|nr:hypothetical protein FIBSPDRAFT_866912 [Fibularhizoctonia sp. CBS 109695]
MTTHGLPVKLTTTNRCTSRRLIALFPLCAAFLYIFLPAFSARGTPPYPTSGSSGMSRAYSNASSAKNVCSVHQIGKTAVYKTIQMARWLHMAPGRSCMRV